MTLASRPVLFALARILAEAWPADASRAQLIAGAFRTRHFDDSHRARLRVEIGRLRALVAPLQSELKLDPTPIAHRTHGLNPGNLTKYDARIAAIDYTLAHDDGISLRNLDQAQVILLGVSLSPYLLGFGGIFYLVVAGFGGAAMLLCALALRHDAGRRRANRAAGRLFAVSILYLFALFATLLAESTVAGLR